ncbi:glycoside hydrolase family 2 TIM barrel-domain containing protein [Flavivirga eckloniae]|uniref:Glycoside hydrolase family 2 n=1 Tax=Flavivirga eckloniae TaxID=1803846 RepID=A0A2K9PRM1_9FLAO|nr:glycoside hydrolase family 2 TIM barrel-domain containing protein [Flavivirga eckloniae]AUP79714.1 glycoside hydrolase family 2 [Flavivirga eckloniae]
MKNMFLFLMAIFLIGCSNTKEELSNDNVLSLNGIWKFFAIYGEGSNYLNIKEIENDLVIDNDASSVEVYGNWRLRKMAERNTSLYGKDYLEHTFTNTDLDGGNKADSSYVRYYPNFKKSGYYEAFTRFPFASHMTPQYNIKHAQGITTKYLNHRVFCNEWISLGIFKFNSEDTNYLEVTAITSGAVAADAVIFREISKEKYLKAKEEPKQVFKKDFDDSKWYNLKVPGHWGMLNDFSNYTGIGWYRKTIDIPKDWTKALDNRYYLKFGGVYHLSKVYLNGKYIGMNRGGFTPFEFDVTDVLNFNGENVIAVQADNSAIVSATWNWGGIIRDVTLTKNKDVRIDYQYIHAEPDLAKGSADIKLRVSIENNSSEKRTIKVNSRIVDAKEISKLEDEIVIEPRKIQDIYLETTLSSDDVELWHFDNPKLYKVETTISDGETILNTRTDNFGIRKIELTSSKMLLNGEPVRIGGFNRVSESRYWGSSEPEAVLEKDVDLMKEAGANFMRIMHGTQSEKLIELCDKKGILLFEEVNVRDLDNDEFRAAYQPLSQLKSESSMSLNDESNEILVLDGPYMKVSNNSELALSNKNYFLSKYWLKGMIKRDINHPSIIGWSVGNELNNHMAYGKEAMTYVKDELDPYRLVTCVSNSGQKDEYTQETDPNTYSDIIMHNLYPWQGEPQDVLNTLRTKWPNKPIFISEFGFGPFPSTGLDSDKEIISEWMSNFRNKNEFVVGTSMWTFNDYRSGYAATTAEENRVWGLINVWRQKRRLFDRIKKEHAPVEDIKIENINFEENTADISIIIKSRSDYPSYTMKDYTLEYEFKNSKGEVVSKNRKDLPILKPEDGLWRDTISWNNLPENILDMTIDLVSSTGHSRFDKTISFQNALTPKISEIILGKNVIRILFHKVPNAYEYFATYQNDEGNIVKSYKTIASYIDIKGLTTGRTYSFKLHALNDKGVSNPSEEITITTSNNMLPPIIWDSFITDNKLVIGYSSDFGDEDYTVKYGTSKDSLSDEFSSNVRGMMSIDLNMESDIYFKIKRTNNSQESNWSQIVKATKTN